MKKSNFKNLNYNLPLTNECLIFLFFVLIFGVSTGVFFELLMDTESKLNMQYYLKNILLAPESSAVSPESSFSGLVSSMAVNLMSVIFIAASGCTRFACPVSGIVLFLKGVSLGYSCALILEALAFKGILVIVLSLFPQNTLLLPVLFVSSNMAVAQASVLSRKKNKGTVRGFNVPDSPYLYTYGVLCAVTAFSCVVQSVCLSMAGGLL